MSAEIVNVEIMPQMALVQVIEDSGVEQTTAARIKAAFLTMFSDAEKWAEKAKTITVTDISQVREMKLARETRLALREIRINAENARKTLKADALATGKAIDGIANVLKALVVPIETRLQEQEDFARLYEEEQARQLHERRRQIIGEFSDVTEITGGDLSKMPEDQFEAMIEGLNAKRARIKREKEEAIRIEREREFARQEAIKNAEEERQRELADAKEQAEKDRAARLEAEKKAEIERIKAEGERVKAEAERQRVEEEHRKDREASEAKQAAQRKADAEAAEAERKIAQAKIEAAEQAQRQAEAERKRIEAEREKEHQLAQRKANIEAAQLETERKKAIAQAEADAEKQKQLAIAPDKEKLSAFAVKIRALAEEIPTLNAKGEHVRIMLTTQIEKFASWCENINLDK